MSIKKITSANALERKKGRGQGRSQESNLAGQA